MQRFFLHKILKFPLAIIGFVWYNKSFSKRKRTTTEKAIDFKEENADNDKANQNDKDSNSNQHPNPQQSFLGKLMETIEKLAKDDY